MSEKQDKTPKEVSKSILKPLNTRNGLTPITVLEEIKHYICVISCVGNTQNTILIT
jgi:hypothetical protein